MVIVRVIVFVDEVERRVVERVTWYLDMSTIERKLALISSTRLELGR